MKGMFFIFVTRNKNAVCLGYLHTDANFCLVPPCHIYDTVDPKVAPSLQAHQEELKRAQLQVRAALTVFIGVCSVKSNDSIVICRTNLTMLSSIALRRTSLLKRVYLRVSRRVLCNWPKPPIMTCFCT